MNEEADRETYVRATARTLGLDLTPEQVTRVTEMLARNTALAALVMELDLPEEIESAAIFRP